MHKCRFFSQKNYCWTLLLHVSCRIILPYEPWSYASNRLDAVCLKFTSPDINQYKKLCNILLSGVYNSEICKQYVELGSWFKEEFFFLKQYHSSYCLLEDCRKLFVDAVQEVQCMFPHVEKILCLVTIPS